MAEKIIYAMYDDDDVLKDGAKKLVAKGVKVSEVFSPFPIHGIDPIIGVKNTRLGIMAFLYAITGTMLATIGMRYFMISDWPMNIGGKPNNTYLQNILAFIPVTFELTVLFTAFGMVITFLIISGLTPWTVPQIFDIRGTDDKFVMAIDLAHNKLSDEQIKEVLTSNGATEVNYKEFKS